MATTISIEEFRKALSSLEEAISFSKDQVSQTSRSRDGSD